MRTIVLQVHPEAPEAEAIARAAEMIQRGGLVAFPTETVYGLGANALDPRALARIFEAKGRPPHNPLIVHVTDVEAAQTLVAAWPETAARLAARYWPGPLTLVLPRRALIPDIVTAGGPTVAVRVPRHPVALALLRASGVPIAAPSANRSARLSPTRAEHVLRSLNGRIEMLLDGGPTAGGLESTVLSLAADPPQLLRPGPVSPSEIEAVIGPVERLAPSHRDEQTPLPSPGMMARHYAPRAPLVCMEGATPSQHRRCEERVEALRRSGRRVGWLRWARPTEQSPRPDLLIVDMPEDPRAYAAQLYAALHTLDEAGVECIVAEMPPDTEAWLAVRDRLRRASTP